MYMFDNLVILSDFKLQKKLALPKNSCRIYVLRLSFYTLMLHPFSLVRIASLFTHVKLVLSAQVLYAYCGVVW